MAKPAGSRRRGARGSLRPGICGPNCASHRGFGIFEGIVCRDIRHWRMIHAALAKGHERVFLRTLLSSFPSICSRQRIADSIASFCVYRYLAFRRRTRRGLNKYPVICPHPFLNFTRIDLGHGSGRAHSKGRLMAANVVLSFNQITFRTGLLLSLSGTRSHYRKHCSGKVTVVRTPGQ